MKLKQIEEEKCKFCIIIIIHSEAFPLCCKRVVYSYYLNDRTVYKPRCILSRNNCLSPPPSPPPGCFGITTVLITIIINVSFVRALPIRKYTVYSLCAHVWRTTGEKRFERLRRTTGAEIYSSINRTIVVTYNRQKMKK